MPQLQATLNRILTEPTPADLWRLGGDLLAFGGEAASQARDVAEVFHSYLRDLESKFESRAASRWGAVLETASVTSVSLQEVIEERENLLKRLLSSGVTAALELGAAAKNVQAWEVESSLVHYDVAWYLYGELWDISLHMRPELPAAQRRTILDGLLNPALDSHAPGEAKADLLVRLFQAALAARVLPLLVDAPATQAAT